ncbi:hypothetical protein [Pseudobacteriovorax antillogorgiicola]|uniref:Uncharacterized protein n=1 Tax=Pseudobacteriovorax antillogorgiicola TaxID=1513793 RepID=A0A1Y6BF11_9BACT|nr:hypothetical protein [Pseudobacteriovorax antillogorgiicola]TCS56345.1 hypothetical protein EDD56_104167 [Pseudobacteriovorax antillogorgiicola]SMF06811.1 hypothetical protein SAMN06296036_104166 [Pseudobacteriovorax antillogorgiicola]
MKVIIYLAWGFLVVVLQSCFHDPTDRTPLQIVNNPNQKAPLAIEAKSPLPIGVDARLKCPATPYYHWLDLDQAPKYLNFKVEQARVNPQISTSRIFEEDLADVGYTYPIRWLTIVPESKDQSRVLIRFRRQAIDSRMAILLGFLPYSANQPTLKLQAEELSNFSESFDVLYSASAIGNRDYDAEIRWQEQNQAALFTHEGPQASVSGILILRPKEGAQFNQLTIRALEPLRGQSFALGLAVAGCAPQICQGINQLGEIKVGDIVGVYSPSDPSFLSTPMERKRKQHFALGRGGMIELEWDGMILNKEGPEFRVFAEGGSIGTCQDSNRYQVFVKEHRQDEWTLVSGPSPICGDQSFDIKSLHAVRYLKILDKSGPDSPQGFRLRGVSCDPEDI